MECVIFRSLSEPKSVMRRNAIRQYEKLAQPEQSAAYTAMPFQLSIQAITAINYFS